MMIKYKKLLIKLSGEAMGDPNNKDIFNPQAIEHITDEVFKLKELGVQVTIIIGGGNIFRGNVADKWKIERAEADNIGMLGTIINSLLLRAAFKSKSLYKTRVMTSIRMEEFAEPYIRLKAINYLNKGYIVIFAGGIGQPYVTTDYPAVQRAIETGCDAIFVAKNGVNGVYSNDPKKTKGAKLYKTLAYEDFITKKLGIMDKSAVLLAQEYNLPIHIFNFNELNVMINICKGDDIGTYISPFTKLT